MKERKREKGRGIEGEEENRFDRYKRTTSMHPQSSFPLSFSRFNHTTVISHTAIERDRGDNNV
jgi:hypothetical protein